MAFPTNLLAPAAAAAILLSSLPLRADPVPPPLPPLTPATSLGVEIHFTHPKPRELKMITAAGFKWVRMDLFWDATEKVRGQYDFSAYDGLLAALDRHKMHALFILGYGNPLYADKGEPTPFTHRAGMGTFREAYAQWAAAAVKHFAGRGCIWEMWNEPNLNIFWQPSPNSDEYIALAKQAAAAIHAAAPGEPLIGPGSSRIDLDFLEACFQGGLLDDWSAVSIHPYRTTDPRTAIADYQKVRDLIARYAPKGRTIPIICSEWGYSTSPKGVDESTQAAYLPREFSTNIAAGIPLTICYDWHDDGATRADPEHRYGLVRHHYHPHRRLIYVPKPAYWAIKSFAAHLAAHSAQ